MSVRDRGQRQGVGYGPIRTIRPGQPGAWMLAAVLVLAAATASPATAQGVPPHTGDGGSAAAAAGETAPLREITLASAMALAEANNLQMQMAQAEVEDARLALEEVRARHLMQPNPILLHQAETGYDLARRRLVLARSQLQLSVEQAYYGVLRVENLAEVAREGVALAERQLTVARDRVAAGAAAAVDALRAESQLSAARARLLQVEGGVQLALLQFRQAVGLPLDEPVRPASLAVEVVPQEIDLEADLAFALENRAELLQARAGVEAARKQVELTENDYTPDLARRRALVALQMAEIGLEQARNGITLEVRQLYQTLLDAGRQVEVLARGVAASEETLRITQAMYEAGVATDLELLNAQTAFLQARTDHVNARFDYREAQMRYAHAVARALAESGSGR